MVASMDWRSDSGPFRLQCTTCSFTKLQCTVTSYRKKIKGSMLTCSDLLKTIMVEMSTRAGTSGTSGLGFSRVDLDGDVYSTQVRVSQIMRLVETISKYDRTSS
mmetsp:Transcript_17964/g.36212  ORF Transcript_17964/g.36212 Transcript_17964/m.36212 type:complete len:104 (-) Transcript_17964:25-336(-)